MLTPKKKPSLLSKKEVARALSVTTRTVSNWVSKGHFPAPAIILGRPRWKTEDVEQYIKGQFAKAR